MCGGGRLHDRPGRSDSQSNGPGCSEDARPRRTRGPPGSSRRPAFTPLCKRSGAATGRPLLLLTVPWGDEPRVNPHETHGSPPKKRPESNSDLCELRRTPFSGSSVTEHPTPPGPPYGLLSARSVGVRFCPPRLLRCALSGLLAALSSLQLRHPGS
jgi:hypothetical protein